MSLESPTGLEGGSGGGLFDGGGGGGSTQPSLTVTGRVDGEAYTVTSGARSLSITAAVGATLATTVELASDGSSVPVTDSTTATPSWTAPTGGTDGDAYQVRVVATLDGLTSSVAFTERISGTAATEPSLTVTGRADGEAYTVTSGGRSLTISNPDGATLSTSVELASDGSSIPVTDSTTTTPSWTAPAGGAAGDAYQVKVAATLGGLSSTVGFTERIAGTGGGSGLTAPTTAYRIDFTDEPTATWNGLAVAVTIDGVSGTYSTRDSTTFGIVNGQGWVIENTVPTTSSSATRFAGGQTNFDLAGNYTAGNLLVITWKVSGGYLDGANDIIVFGAWNNFGADGPGGSVFMNGDGTFDVVTFNNAGSSQTLATSTATHTNPAAYYIRQVLDTAAGVSRLYFSTSAPGTLTLSGGMTYLGSTRSDVVRAASNTPLDAMPSAFIQTRFYRGTNTGTPMTATVEYIDVLELAV